MFSTSMNSLSPYSNPVALALLSSPFIEEETGSEGLSSLPRVAHTGDGQGLEPRPFYASFPAFGLCTALPPWGQELTVAWGLREAS